MQPDQIAVTITRQGTRVTARTSGPPAQEDAAGAFGPEHGYAHLTAPLRQRGLVCTVEYGLSDYIVHAELPDGSALTISPPQEPPADHPPGHPGSWLVTRSSPYNTAVHEVLYNSEPGGPHAENGGSAAPLLAAIDVLLDQLGLPSAAPSSALEPLNAADAVLHRAGFVSEVTHHGRFHHLPAGMTDPVEQRRAVTRAVDMLGAEGFAYAVEADLLDNSQPVGTHHEMSLGDQLGHLTQAISRAGHTSQAVAVLSELTAPGDGVLDRLTEALDATADWWEGLGEETDPLYAARLRRINQHISVSVLEIQNLRNTLADRHTAHPGHAQPDPVPAQEPRVAAALAFSPFARRSRPAPTPAIPAATAAPPAARPERTR
ncbi:hypothetical protein [Actinacidiphila paucisporea]|uniref:Uncharacterized protein n=1 Tax=Actinacidiphila paucisporea TaxID=310782 RepID=A0A1M7PYV6_9ACTN|nr:hypothetical protein [Actinacidiphila paucisporea]SHN22932.1 hypothetical protein SAMN05216499_12755 [Actinacidiphila paucisporea]